MRAITDQCPNLIDVGTWVPAAYVKPVSSKWSIKRNVEWKGLAVLVLLNLFEVTWIFLYIF